MYFQELDMYIAQIVIKEVLWFENKTRSIDEHKYPDVK